MPADDKKPNLVDIHVGNRVRLRRKFLGMSQETLAGHLELTFQQVQKYERGSNRISASKLFNIATVLKTPIEYFFEGCEDGLGLEGFIESASEKCVSDFLMTNEGIELAEAFPRITSPKRRRKILELVRSLSEDET